MVNRLCIREGNTGILFIKENEGNETRYIPDYDMDKGIALLKEFQELRDDKGMRLKDNYLREGYDWYLSVINYLFGHFFWNYVKYKPILERVVGDQVKLSFENERGFYDFVTVVKGVKRGNFGKKILFNVLLAINNKVVVKKYKKADILLFRLGPNDFRSVRLKKALDEANLEYIEVNPGEKKEILKNIVKMKALYFYSQSLVYKNMFCYTYGLDGLEHVKKLLFTIAVSKIELMISASIHEYKAHRKILKGGNFKTFLGIDDTQAIYPLLYACRENRIRTIGYQHGAEFNKRLPHYSLPGIKKQKWFDNIIVYGEYWKRQLLSVNKLYPEKSILVGADLFDFASEIRKAILNPKSQKEKANSKNILIPYEFLSNTYKIGRYIKKFIGLGFNIYFKPRPISGKLEDQLEAYCLPQEYINKIKIVDQIDNNVMKNIDIVAGTMTSLIYQLLPYNKVVWLLDTEIQFMEDLLKDGFAQKIKYEDIETLEEKYLKENRIDVNYFYSGQSLTETVRRYIIDSYPDTSNTEGG